MPFGRYALRLTGSCNAWAGKCNFVFNLIAPVEQLPMIYYYYVDIFYLNGILFLYLGSPPKSKLQGCVAMFKDIHYTCFKIRSETIFLFFSKLNLNYSPFSRWTTITVPLFTTSQEYSSNIFLSQVSNFSSSSSHITVLAIRYVFFLFTLFFQTFNENENRHEIQYMCLGNI